MIAVPARQMPAARIAVVQEDEAGLDAAADAAAADARRCATLLEAESLEPRTT
jgi:hypothetical protein